MRLIVPMVALCAAITSIGCGTKKPAKPAKSPATAAKAEPDLPAAAHPLAPASAAKPIVGPADGPTPPKAVVALPVAATVTKREDSVALFFSDAGSADFALPTAGKPSTVRATAIEDGGRPIKALVPVAGSPLILIAARTDLSWVSTLAPAKLNGTDGATHTFAVTFPHAGPHILLFVFQPVGGARVMMPSYVNVKGKRLPDGPPGGAQETWKGPRGLQAKLLGNPLIDVCTPTGIATTWTRRGKPLTLQPLVADKVDAQAKSAAKPIAHPDVKAVAPPAPTLVTYVVLRPGLDDVQFVTPPAATDANAATVLTKLPKETAAVFVPQATGSTALLAIARVHGEPVVARFDVVVGGELPKGGCAK